MMKFLKMFSDIYTGIGMFCISIVCIIYLLADIRNKEANIYDLIFIIILILNILGIMYNIYHFMNI